MNARCAAISGPLDLLNTILYSPSKSRGNVGSVICHIMAPRPDPQSLSSEQSNRFDGAQAAIEFPSFRNQKGRSDAYGAHELRDKKKQSETKAIFRNPSKFPRQYGWLMVHIGLENDRRVRLTTLGEITPA